MAYQKWSPCWHRHSQRICLASSGAVMFIFRIETPKGYGLYSCGASRHIQVESMAENPPPDSDPELRWWDIRDSSEYYFGFANIKQAALWMGGYSHLGDLLDNSDAVMGIYDAPEGTYAYSPYQAIFQKKIAKFIGFRTNLKKLLKEYGHVVPAHANPRIHNRLLPSSLA